MSENGGAGASGNSERAVVSPGRIIGGGARSASPAKRRAAEMEGDKKDSDVPAVPTVVPPPGSFPKDDGEPETTDYDIAMADLQGSNTETVDSHSTSADGDASKASSATSNGDGLPAYGEDDNERWAKSKPGSEKVYVYTTEETDAQVAKVTQMSQRMPSEGDIGVCVSNRWLKRVRSRTTDGLRSSKDFPEDAREGPVGRLDNSDIVPEGGFDDPTLQDVNGKKFVPLKPDLIESIDFTILPESAYTYITTQYGSIPGQKAIWRYAHNTAAPGAVSENVEYEYNPPVITVQKVPQPSEEKSNSPFDSTRLRQDGKVKYGQRNETDALRMVSSKSEAYQKFVIRAKNAAGIPVKNKIKVFRLKNSESQDVGPAIESMTPPASRSGSPAKAEPPSLVITPEAFEKMENQLEVSLNSESVSRD